MADVYEKDLGQKSSLTTSDYIRVVGSDNVSYKQLVSDVANKILATQGLGVANTVQTWVPHLYDYQTKLRDLGTGHYVAIGKLVFAWFSGNNLNYSGINTMMQIRNLPMSAVLGGSVYIANLNGQGAYQTIQSNENLYLRPNVKSSDFPDPTQSGWSSFLIIGYNN